MFKYKNQNINTLIRESYEEIIYENLKKKVKNFISDLEGEDFLPEKPNDGCSMYVGGMIAYLGVIIIIIKYNKQISFLYFIIRQSTHHLKHYLKHISRHLSYGELVLFRRHI